MKDLGVEKGLGMFFNIVDESSDKILRFPTTRPYEYSVPAIDPLEDLPLRSKLPGIFLLHFIECGALFFLPYLHYKAALFPFN
jgi:hypothetical protein